MSECTCGEKFRDAEDFRDHLPCPGSKEKQAFDQGFQAGVKHALDNPGDGSMRRDEPTQNFNREAYDTLLAYETLYLQANGWKQGPRGEWSNEALRREGLVHGHAVNVQKQRDRWAVSVSS
jgi:hypothetical protein